MSIFIGTYGMSLSSDMAVSNSSATSATSATVETTSLLKSIAQFIDTAGGVTIGLIIAYLAYKHFSEARRRGFPHKKAPLPPGPPGDFIIGHYRHIPEEESFRKYQQWSKQYSKSK